MYIYMYIYIKYGRILSHAKSHFNMNRWHYIFATLVVGYQAESAQFFVQHHCGLEDEVDTGRFWIIPSVSKCA